MEAKLLLIPWGVAVVYSSIPLFWFAIHPFASSWRRMKRSPYRALLPLWTAMIVALGCVTWPWHAIRLYSTAWAWLAAAPLFVAGLRTYSKIFSEFGGHKLSGEAELRVEEHEQKLVTTGLHGRMRHPIYFAHLCNMAGWALGSGLMIVYVLLAISVLLTFPLMIHFEEQELENRFGESYRSYKSLVPVIPVPFLHSLEKRTSA